jgi:hypothetical protein
MEFIVTRHGEPILFIHSLAGATWANKTLVFDRPIEKIGQGLALQQDGKTLTEDHKEVVRIVAHWKKRLKRRSRDTGLPLEALILTGPFDEFD